jgi:hypothetical protein
MLRSFVSPWPLLAAGAARVDAIAAARKGLNAVRRMPKTETSAAMFEVLDALHEIIHNLTSVGPQAQENKKAGMLVA